MRRLAVVYLFGLSTFFASTESRIYTNCDVAHALQNQGVPWDQLGSWVCIAKHESNFDTQAINWQTGDYGIFQISHLYWCNDGNQPGKGCGVTCQSLLSDDISADIRCVRTIFTETEKMGRYGFSAWVAYNNYCANRNNWDYVANCF